MSVAMKNLFVKLYFPDVGYMFSLSLGYCSTVPLDSYMNRLSWIANSFSEELIFNVKPLKSYFTYIFELDNT